MIERIETDWNDEKSISKSERKKAKLENLGFTLISTIGGPFRSVMVYKK